MRRYTVKVERLECDNCHVQVGPEEVRNWLRVFTVVGTEEAMMEMANRVEAGERPFDTGDFCTLRCLGEWAFAQELLRDLEGGDEA
jgi:hypothetical protein